MAKCVRCPHCSPIAQEGRWVTGLPCGLQVHRHLPPDVGTDHVHHGAGQANCGGCLGTTSVYCLLWFFLVDLYAGGSRGLQCGYQVACSLYLPIYLLDFTVFFLAPLLAATVLYGLIARILFWSTLAHLP